VNDAEGKAKMIADLREAVANVISAPKGGKFNWNFTGRLGILTGRLGILILERLGILILERLGSLILERLGILILERLGILILEI